MWKWHYLIFDWISLSKAVNDQHIWLGPKSSNHKNGCVISSENKYIVCPGHEGPEEKQSIKWDNKSTLDYSSSTLSSYSKKLNKIISTSVFNILCDAHKLLINRPLNTFAMTVSHHLLLQEEPYSIIGYEALGNYLLPCWVGLGHPNLHPNPADGSCNWDPDTTLWSLHQAG